MQRVILPRFLFIFVRAHSSVNGRFTALKSTMLPPGSFQGKVAFVTGGGTGLGKGMVAKLSELGASVTICGRKLDVVEKTASEISSKTGNQVLACQCDVRNPEAIKAAADVCVSELGLPNMIINNAAGNFISPTEQLSCNAFRTILEIVLHGTAFVTLEFGKRLIKSNQGCSFLSISTTYTKHGSGFVVPSAAAKAGVEAITKSLAAEWGRYGMRFNVIAPGPIETKGAFSRLDPTGEFRKNMLQRIPIGRLGEVEELANLATYILSDYANWMTGEVVTFDGGELPRMAGEFNDLLSLPAETWDELQSMIKATKGS